MARTTYQLMPIELRDFYRRAMSSGDRFLIPSVRRKKLFFSRNRKRGLTLRSLIPELSMIWNNLPATEKEAWAITGRQSNLKGFNHFLKDRAFRLRNNLTGFATPHNLHQVEVGMLRVRAPATSLSIEQLHPEHYWIMRRVVGFKNKFEPVEIRESFSLPLSIKINYRAELESIGAGAYARYSCVVYSHYQGRTIPNYCIIEIPLTSDWATADATINNVIGEARGYRAEISIYNARGDLYFDNIEMIHSGQNWARDPFCNNIEQTFTKAFFQIPRHWVARDISEGAFYRSVYKDFM